MAKHICLNCGTQGNPSKHTKGSIWIELVLWLLFIVPGLLYSLWRLTSKVLVCPSCKQPVMIPIDSPKGKEMMAQYITKPAEKTKRRDQMTLQEILDSGMD